MIRVLKKSKTIKNAREGKFNLCPNISYSTGINRNFRNMDANNANITTRVKPFDLSIILYINLGIT